MLPIDIKLVKKIEVDAKEYLNSNEKLLLFLKDNYENEELEFHYVFIKSNLIKNIGMEFLEQLFYELKELNMINWQKIGLDIAFFIHVMKFRKQYKDKLEELINNSKNKIYGEDFFAYFEYLNLQVLRRKEAFGDNYIEGVTESQLEHIYDTFEEMISLISEFKINFLQSVPYRYNESCKEILEIVAHITAVQNYYEEVTDRLSNPIATKDFWYLDHVLSYWVQMEKYRDLNIQFQFDNDNTEEEIKDIMQNIEALTIYGDNNIWKLDASKEEAFKSILEINQSYKLLYPIYGEKETTFIYKCKEYRIDNILELYSAVYNFVLKEFNNTRDNEKKRCFLLYGRKSLLRRLNLKDTKIGNLLDLLTFYCGKDDKNIIGYKPLLRKGELFYLLPSRIEHMTIHRVIDKILSSNEISVNFEIGKGNSWKGIVFEKNIENFLKENKIQFYSIRRNDKQKIPEIDGIFLIDKYIFIYEAKAFIKPETIVEAYEKLRDILFFKAKEQLDFRINKILNEDSVRKYIEDKIGISFEGKVIAPFILVSNSFFSGYQEIKNNFQNSYYPIVDFDMLKKIIEKWEIPIWNYNSKTQNYEKSNKKIKNGEELWDFMLNQFKNLKTIEDPVFVCGDEKIAYQIVKPIKIR